MAERDHRLVIDDPEFSDYFVNADAYIQRRQQIYARELRRLIAKRKRGVIKNGRVHQYLPVRGHRYVL